MARYLWCVQAPHCLLRSWVMSQIKICFIIAKVLVWQRLDSMKRMKMELIEVNGGANCMHDNAHTPTSLVEHRTLTHTKRSRAKLGHERTHTHTSRHYWWVKLISLGINLNWKCLAERKLSDKSDKLTPHQNFFTLTLALSQSPFYSTCSVCILFSALFLLSAFLFDYVCFLPLR